MTPGDELETVLRGPKSYSLAKQAVALMEAAKVWPTPLNFELWLHVAGQPDGALAGEVSRLLSSGESITEALSEDLAARFLPKQRLKDQIKGAGDQLSRELDTVSDAIREASRNQENYGKVLDGAGAELGSQSDAAGLRTVMDRLSQATSTAREQNQKLEERLAASNAELNRLKAHLEQARHEASTDALTKLPNRKAFDEALRKALLAADADGGPVSLAVLDIDHFKRFNDTWGHQTGDQVLRFVASVIGRAGGPPRFAARYGGEEFAVIFPGEGAAQALAVLEGIRGEVSSRSLKRRSTNDDLGQVTISGGLATRVPGEALECLVERADAALYTSKRAGRNRNTKADAPIGTAAAA